MTDPVPTKAERVLAAEIVGPFGAKGVHHAVAVKIARYRIGLFAAGGPPMNGSFPARQPVK